MHSRDRADAARRAVALTQAEITGSLLGRARRIAGVFAKYGLRETRGSGDSAEVRARRLRDSKIALLR